MKEAARSSPHEGVRNVRGQLPLILGLTGGILGAIAFSYSLSMPKIGVVRIDALVYRYAGTKEAQKIYKDKYEVWEQEADSLDREFNAALEKYRADEKTLAEGQRKKRRKELELLQQSLTRYKSDLAEKAREEDRELTEAALGQINEFVEKYGKESGYDIILGINGTGNILHSTEYLDLTEDVIEALNRSYKLADNR